MFYNNQQTKFRLHKTAKAEQTSQFFIEWEKYLQHIERTGRGKQSMDVGLVDVPPQQQQQHQQQHKVVVNNVTSSSSSSSSTIGLDHRQNNNNGNGGGMSFGKDVPKGVAFNEEQESQLEKLREEAVKAGKEHGGGGGGGGR
mmetsp:Transcript_10634/g.17169  ORF Transcript_10634/g.17169 Transcript_10634/m.17169 type:complete len:142 (+) Transcript_10634:453-878(+)|eukprot:CAMPEP_0196130402 /NCGR_PEP_ID=MMETSP0910-20130528/786_1 /TAXON_ID=49265 /ORGANISM="Thalassiosira rotula, Strain GSO102" /LENGTH=141 /DNA_ID=CAMNT_0041389699 /DNA_START=395 /DNA_END=820 /DNA_ORIENTATION=-